MSSIVDRLRSPEPFGKAGLAVAILALVFAATGAAFAAKAALTSKQKKEVEKIAKKFAGTPGPAGPAGAPGAKGVDGKDGASVQLAAATGCSEGGTKLTVGTESTEVCNGEEGPQGATGAKGAIGAQGATGAEGPEGSPWTAGGTLPSGKTEQGTWSFGMVSAEGSQLTSVSFTIPLAEPLDEEHVHYVSGEQQTNGEVPVGCTVKGVEGSKANPLAAPGNLCVYEAFGKPGTFLFITNPESSEFNFAIGAGRSGANLAFHAEEAGNFGRGVWAVTAP